MSVHYLEEVRSGRKGQLSLYIRWNCSRFIVHLTESQPTKTPLSIENSFIERYKNASNCDDLDDAGIISQEILDTIVHVGRLLFDNIAPPPSLGSSLPRDLHSLLFPKEYNFSFQTVNGMVKVVRINDHDREHNVLLGRAGQPFHLNVASGFDLPTYTTKEIYVVKDLLDEGYIAHVIVGGREMCSKAGDSKGEDAAQMELDCLLKITSSSYSAELRVPKLLGLIKTPDNNNFVGFLEEYVPVAESWDLATLGNIDDITSIDESRRKKWALQVQETVQLLHAIGVIWGDGKASNVLIHRETDDAWIIDFGGGWTQGWVEEPLSGTVEGDEVAVKKILEYLQI